MQQECNRQGFSHQEVDGIVGEKTLKGCPQLFIHSKGEITKLIQERLSMLNYPVGSIDGIHGKLTHRAICLFQQDYQLKVDGIVGNETWKKLLNM